MSVADDCLRDGPVDPELPLALGYVWQHLLTVESGVNRTKERLGDFAQVSGLRLGGVYVEEIETWPAAFEALLQVALVEKPRALIVPSLIHLAVLGAPVSIKQHIERLTGARVLAASVVVPYLPGAAAS